MRRNKQVSCALTETALFRSGFTFQYKGCKVRGVGCGCGV